MSKNIIIYPLKGVLAAAVTFGLYRAGVWFDSLLTVHTPLWYTLHSWGSVIVSVLVGLGVVLNTEVDS